MGAQSNAVLQLLQAASWALQCLIKHFISSGPSLDLLKHMSPANCTYIIAGRGLACLMARGVLYNLWDDCKTLAPLLYYARCIGRKLFIDWMWFSLGASFRWSGSAGGRTDPTFFSDLISWAWCPCHVFFLKTFVHLKADDKVAIIYNTTPQIIHFTLFFFWKHLCKSKNKTKKLVWGRLKTSFDAKK